MRDQLTRRRADFQQRADYAPQTVYSHRGRGIRYITVHRFADEGVNPPEGQSVDAWCELSTDVALIESRTARFSGWPAGIWIRRDAESPQFLKVIVVLDEPGIARVRFEEILELVADHPLALDGFASVLPGSARCPLSLE